jgi:hypothetical protein
VLGPQKTVALDEVGLLAAISSDIEVAMTEACVKSSITPDQAPLTT